MREPASKEFNDTVAAGNAQRDEQPPLLGVLIVVVIVRHRLLGQRRTALGSVITRGPYSAIVIYLAQGGKFPSEMPKTVIPIT